MVRDFRSITLTVLSPSLTQSSPSPTLRPEGSYLRRAWEQSVYPIARRMGVPITHCP